MGMERQRPQAILRLRAPGVRIWPYELNRRVNVPGVRPGR